MNSLLDTLAGMTEAVASAQPERRPTTNPETKCVVDRGMAEAKAGAKVSVVPYNALADPQADSFLHWMWHRMQTDDLVDYYFPGQRETGFANFVRLFSGDAQVALVLNEAATDKWEDRVMGFLTWTATRLGASNMIIAGFVFFKKFWGHAHTDEVGKVAFKFWFSQEPAIDVVLGLCPSLHQLAMRYNQRVGLREIGRIPKAHIYKGKPCDAVLYALSRDEWKERV